VLLLQALYSGQHHSLPQTWQAVSEADSGQAPVPPLPGVPGVTQTSPEQTKPSGHLPLAEHLVFPLS
jgi:hypothetical protein